MKKKIYSCIIIWAVTLLSVIFCTVLSMLGDSPVSPAPIEKIKDESGKDIYAVCISDLGEINTLPYVNYVADRFVRPDTFNDMGEVIPVNGGKLAPRGTLQFVILNLNPDDENFKEKSAALAPRLEGDNNWHFTMYLPQVFSACNVYARSTLISRTGEIGGYEFINFSEYRGKTEAHKDGTALQYIDLQFYTRHSVMTPELSRRALEITVHYEAQGGRQAGLYEMPLIGSDKAVRAVKSNNLSFSYALAVLSVIVFSAFVFLCFLKRNVSFALQLLLAASVFTTMISIYLFMLPSSAPYLLLSFRKLSIGICLVAACFNLPKRILRIPVRYFSAVFAFTASVLAFCVPLVPMTVSSVLTVCYLVLAVIASVVVLISTTYAILRGGSVALNINNSLSVVLVIFSAFFTRRYVNLYFSPSLWMCILILAVITVVGLREFVTMEKQNRHLTANLNTEVNRQLKDIKAVVAERDNLLRFVSHDMKKPLQSSALLLEAVLEREKDEEQKKALRIIRQNNSRVIGNLSDIGSYARFNYIAEPSQVVDLKDLCAVLYEFHKPDCNANGIILNNSVEKQCKVYVKKQGLENVVSNLVLNAIEHANCKNVTFSVKTDRDRVVLSIADDGKGIPDGTDVFRPYVSENKPDTGGVGLYICKNIIESMSGELSYESEAGNTVFHISLLAA